MYFIDQEQNTKPSTYICALLFSLAILVVMTGCIVTAFLSTGPLVLGTELNTNGSIEYLCLGTDCERLWF